MNHDLLGHTEQMAILRKAIQLMHLAFEPGLSDERRIGRTLDLLEIVSYIDGANT